MKKLRFIGFFNYHSAEKYSKMFSSPKHGKCFFSEMETSEKKLICLWQVFQKIMDKKITYCRKAQRETLFGSKRFLQSENFKKIQGGKIQVKTPFDRIQKFSEKSRIVPKKPKGGPFGLHSTFGSIRNSCGLV